MALDFEEAVRYPSTDDDWILTVFVGGVLTFFSFLLLPLLPVYGFLIRVLRAGMNDDPPPSWSGWGELFVQRFVAFVIAFIYQLIPLIVVAVSVGGSIAAFVSGSPESVGMGIASLLGGLSLAFLLTIIFGYIGLIGLANYAREGRFGAAFDVGLIKRVGLNRTYAIHWIYGVVILIAASVVTSILGIIPFLGIVGVFVIFYAMIAAGRVWGRGFAGALDESEGAAA